MWIVCFANDSYKSQNLFPMKKYVACCSSDWYFKGRLAPATEYFFIIILVISLYSHDIILVSF